MTCISTMCYNILHDSQKLCIILSQEGTRQGDPLSSYLFIIYVDAFSTLIRNKETIRQIHGSKIVWEYLLYLICFLYMTAFIL